MIGGVPSILTVTYISAFTNGIASAQSTFVLTIPVSQNGSVAGVVQTVVPIEATAFVRQCFLNGGVWNGLTFIPWSQITGIAAS